MAYITVQLFFTVRYVYNQKKKRKTNEKFVWITTINVSLVDRTNNYIKIKSHFVRMRTKSRMTFRHLCLFKIIRLDSYCGLGSTNWRKKNESLYTYACLSFTIQAIWIFTIFHIDSYLSVHASRSLFVLFGLIFSFLTFILIDTRRKKTARRIR